MTNTQKQFIGIIFGLVFLFGMLVPGIGLAQVTEEADAQIDAELERLLEIRQELEGLQAEVGEAAEPGMFDVPEVETIEVKATVTEILSETEDEQGFRQMIFRAEADGQTYEINTAQSLLEGLRYSIDEGDRVYLQIIEVDGEVNQTYLVDVIRTNALLWIAIVFAVLIIIVGRLRGLMALGGLFVTLLILFGVILPGILAGFDAVLTTIFGSILILAVNMHLSHGVSKQTFFAFLSTVIGLLLVVLFAELFVAFADLSGLASEESVLLYFQSNTITVPQGILLAAIILGAVGVLDDIAITQSETVTELRAANPKMDKKELYAAAMRVGRHHIASTVNTLVLAYAGVALPLLLLFLANTEITGMRFINEEPVAEEVVRTLAGTIALVLTVPVSTWFATYAKKK